MSKRSLSVEGAARIFAGEFSRATRPWPVGEHEGVLSPFGLPCRLLFIAGALLEIQRRGPDFWTGRVADPSGVFEFRTGQADSHLRQGLKDLAPPVFVTLLGEARPGRPQPAARPVVSVVEMGETARSVRDLWILRTAELTTARLFEMRTIIRTGTGNETATAAVAMYGTTETDIREMAETVYQMLAGISSPSRNTMNNKEVRETVLAIIRESAGAGGISLELIIDAAGKSGIDESSARDAVKTLVEEDECYQPARNVFKPL
jgi:RPA family protein